MEPARAFLASVQAGSLSIMSMRTYTVGMLLAGVIVPLSCAGDETDASSSSARSSAGGTAGAGPGGAGGGGGIPTSADCTAPSGQQGGLGLTAVISGLTEPLAMAVPWGDDERKFVIEKEGRVMLWQNGQLTTFLDITQRVSVSANERGLLGIAFHPAYGLNGRFFLHYSVEDGVTQGASDGDTVIAEYRRDPNDPNAADPMPVVEPVLWVSQPYPNHNGGSIEFSPVDGMLYVALGDGGSGGDPDGNGQQVAALLGKLLRIDVSDTGTSPAYAIPAGNLSVANAAPEIFDWGLRNPYRISFDPCTGDRYIGDVGQDEWEEVDIASAAQGPTNWGWNTMEGMHCFSPQSGCDMGGLELPVAEYQRQGGCASVTGGAVYRGSAIPWLRGAYLYADFCDGRTWMLRWEDGQLTEGPTALDIGLTGGGPTGFANDDEGELYAVHLSGFVYRLDPQ